MRDCIVFAALAVFSLSVAAISLTWLTVLPTIGLLWCVGWLK